MDSAVNRCCAYQEIIDARPVRATTPHFIRRVGSLKETRHEWCFHDHYLLSILREKERKAR